MESTITIPDTQAPKQQRKPIPADLLAIWGAFLYEGLLASDIHSARQQRILATWHRGCVELIEEACGFLPHIWRELDAIAYSDTFPGVIEYDVIAPLGCMIGDYLLANDGSLPSRQWVQTSTRELVGTVQASTSRPCD